MQSYLFLHPETITQQQLEQEMLPLLPAWRREQVLNFTPFSSKVLCAKSFLLLKEGLEKDFGITQEVSFDYLEHGKPVLKEYPHIHFNLSHCKNGVLCVIDEKGPVGCDIEPQNRKVRESLLLKCCNEQEIEAIRNNPCPDQAFMRLWTRKEAVLKYTGQGLTQDLPSLLSDKLLETVELETFQEEDVFYSICQSRQMN